MGNFENLKDSTFKGTVYEFSKFTVDLAVSTTGTGYIDLK